MLEEKWFISCVFFFFFFLQSSIVEHTIDTILYCETSVYLIQTTCWRSVLLYHWSGQVKAIVQSQSTPLPCCSGLLSAVCRNGNEKIWYSVDRIVNRLPTLTDKGKETLFQFVFCFFPCGLFFVALNFFLSDSTQQLQTAGLWVDWTIALNLSKLNCYHS